MARAGTFVACTLAAAFATVAWSRSGDLATANASTLIALWTMVLGVWLLAVSAFILQLWRPLSRPWKFMAALSLTWSAFVIAATTDGTMSTLLNPAVLIRPILFALLLSWPSGRLRRADAMWLAVYSAAQAISFWLVQRLFADELGDNENPIAIFDVPRLVAMFGAFGSSVVLPVGAILLVGSVRRRERAMPTAGRLLHRPVLWAAAIVAISELVLVTSDYLGPIAFVDGEPTLFGGFILFVNYLPYVSTPLLVLEAARRTRTLEGAPSTSIEIGPAREVLRDTIATALDDPTATVAFRRLDTSWVDRDGVGIDIDRADRTVTLVERDGAVVAAVTHSIGITPSPDSIELAIAATGATIEYGRLEALANARRHDALVAREAMDAASVAAREQLERDLHDGAQQRLVGLALQASLAARDRSDSSHDDIADELRAGVAAARRELADTASGVMQTLVAERGLGHSIATLAASTAMDVDVRVRYPADVPADIAAAAWFVVAEAVANATKHSGARRLTISGGVTDNRLEVSVADDGRGGADRSGGSGLDGLERRVLRSGGHLDVVSELGVGTVVRAQFLLGGVPE